MPVCGRQQFDIVSSFFGLEAATFSRNDFQYALDNATSYARTGSHLLFAFLANTDSYEVAGKKFKAFPLGEKLLKEEMDRLSCKIIHLKGGPSAQHDYASSIWVWAQK